jgi:signal peptidase I
LSIDGRPVERERVGEEGDCQIWRENYEEASFKVADCPSDPDVPSADIVLGDDEFFVLGDNRNNAVDSRYLGPISFEDIRGRAESFFGLKDSRYR